MIASFLLAAAAACSGDCVAQESFVTLEQRLDAARSLLVEVDAVCEGAVVCTLRESLLLAPGGRVRFAVKGTYGGEPVDALFVSDGKRTRQTAKGKTIWGKTPKALHDALFIGFSRMGLTHNSANLSGGRPPDLTDGKIRTTLEAVDFLPLAQRPGLEIIPFKIFLAGKRAGTGVVWLDGETGLPVRRYVTVNGPTGELKVTEDYPLLVLEAPWKPADFSTK